MNEQIKMDFDTASGPSGVAAVGTVLHVLGEQRVPARVVDYLREEWTGVVAGKSIEEIRFVFLWVIGHTCPRCMGMIPTNDKPGEYRGSMSRTDRVPGPPTEICSPCGDAEGTIACFAAKEGKDPMAAMRADRARWLLPEVARPFGGVWAPPNATRKTTTRKRRKGA